jgi:hypothetical protein
MYIELYADLSKFKILLFDSVKVMSERSIKE